MGTLLLLFIIVPIIEWVLLTKIGAAIGVMNTIALVLLTGVVGAGLFRLEGRRAWRQWQQSLAAGRMPAEGVLGGVLLLLGGALLITPGVLTDAVGLMLLIPQTRMALATWLKPRIMDRFLKGAGKKGGHFGATFHTRVGRTHLGGPPSGAGSAPLSEPPLRRRPVRQAEPPTVIDADFEVVDQ